MAAAGAVTRQELLALVPLLQSGELQQLEQRAAQLAARDPACGGAWKALGVALELQHKDAVPALQRAVQLLREDAQAHASLGAALLRTGRTQDAIASLQRALELSPADPDLHSNLGNALRVSGRPGEALACYRAAVRLAPSRPELHGNVGQACWQLGLPEEAARSFRDALALRPEELDYLAGLAMALVAVGRPDEALQHAQRAIALAPRSPEALNTFGNVLLDLGRDAEAEAAFRAALDQRPQFAQALGNLAIALRLQGRAEQAIEVARRALQLDPGSTGTMVVLADALADRGDFGQAEQRLREALSIDPDSAQACAGLAHLRRMTSHDSAWLAQAMRIAAREDLAPRLQVLLRYAMGKYHDDLQQYNDAFEQYRRANELSRRHRARYDPQRWEQQVQRLVQTQDDRWLQRAMRHGIRSTRPVFVVGMPRSGTSLIEQILSSHREVHGAGELSFWNSAAGALERGGDAEAEADIACVAGEYLQQLDGLSKDAARVVDKMPDNFRHLGLMHAALPAARIVHVQRHPIDNCLSIYFQDFKATLAYATDLGDLAHYYRHYRRLMRHWRSVLGPGAMLEIPYESLVADPEPWIRRLLGFLDLTWDERCLEFQATRRNVVTASRWQVRQRISAASVGRWRRYEEHVKELLPLQEESVIE